MKIILFGATGMVGQGALRECLLDSDVEQVLAIVRKDTGPSHPKLRTIVHPDVAHLSAIEGELSGYDACLFCLGVSAAGMTEADYRRVTYDLTLAVAATLVKKNPAMTFIYVSGSGTDSTERGRAMWARVKGCTENALMSMPFRAAYMFRPGFIQPFHGVRSGTAWYRAIYAVLGPFYPVLRVAFPKFVTNSEALGRAMIAVAKRGYARRILDNDDINNLASNV